MTNRELELVKEFQDHAKHIAMLTMELNKTGISIAMNINATLGIVDRFDIFRNTKIEMQRDN